MEEQKSSCNAEAESLTADNGKYSVPAKNTSRTLRLTRIAVVAALYIALTWAAGFMSFGPFQFRISEALTILPLFGWEYVAALTVGVFLSNTISWFGIIDMFLGALATLIAAVLTRLSRKIYLGVIPPIVVNALIVPIIIIVGSDYGMSSYWFFVMTVGLGQTAVLLTLGVLLYFVIRKNKKLYEIVANRALSKEIRTTKIEY